MTSKETPVVSVTVGKGTTTLVGLGPDGLATFISWSMAPEMSPDEKMALYLEEKIDALNKSLGLCEPIGEKRRTALKVMFQSIFMTREHTRFYWPRKCGLEAGEFNKYDFGKSTTIQLFLYMWIKCGVTSKSVRVEFPAPAIASFFIKYLQNKTSGDIDFNKRILKWTDDVICFASDLNVDKMDKKELLNHKSCGKIYIGSTTKGNKRVNTDVVIYEETGFKSKDNDAKTGRVKFLFYSTLMKHERV